MTNAKGAAAKGFDTPFQLRLFSHLTLNGTVAYTDAKYTDDFSFTAPNGA